MMSSKNESMKLDIKTVGAIIAAVAAAVGGGGYAVTQCQKQPIEKRVEVVDAETVKRIEKMEDRQLELMQRVSALETRQEVLINMVKDIQREVKHINRININNGGMVAARKE